jgi:hypothetical protein
VRRLIGRDATGYAQQNTLPLEQVHGCVGSSLSGYL